MQCRELFQEMAIDIIPPYMIAAKVGLRSLRHSLYDRQLTGPSDIRVGSSRIPRVPGSSSSIYNQGIRDLDRLRNVTEVM